MAGNFSISAHDPSEDTDEQIADRVALGTAIQAEVFPDDPPPDLDQAIAAERARPERLRRWSVRAHDERGVLVAAGSSAIDPLHDDNPDVFHVSLHVHRDHRRQGIATELLRGLVGIAEAEGRTRILFETLGSIPAGDVMAESVGAERKQWVHVNHLPVEAIDRPMLERWVAEGPVRAAGYELIAFDGACPDEHLEGMMGQILVLNTAPRDDLEVNDFTISEESVRDHERQLESAGIEEWVLLARHVESGEYAGMHDVSWNPKQPTKVEVGLTAVDPAHRGHAIGKWLKAAMTLRILDERPDVVEIRTGNADSNDAMLGINKLMGYRPLLGATEWEVATATARAWVDARPTTTSGAGEVTAAAGSQP